MSIDSVSLFANLATCGPMLAIVGLLCHYKLRRVVWSHRKSRGKKRPGFRPSSSALGNAFQFLGVLYRPSVAWVVEAKQREEDAELDEEAEPADPVVHDTPLRHFHRQLRRIRQGKPIDTLVLRL
jgi:hypothetical protein